MAVQDLGSPSADGLVSITAGATASRGLGAPSADGGVATTAGATASRSFGSLSANGLVSITAGATASRSLGNLSANGLVSITASSHEDYFVDVLISTSAVFAVYPPTITHHFPAPRVPTSTLPVVRSVPNPPPISHVVIAPPKPAVQAGPTSAVNVKKTK
jgi:hypothetical protein